VGDTLISLLRQLRAGYHRRPAAFPQSVILCGVRDVRDYRIHTKDQEIITGGSAFNIKAESLRLGNFSREETESLFQQHTDDTGQVFAPEIFEELWQDSQGQPWLVNALGRELTWQNKALRDRSLAITLEHYQAARERLIYSRATHLDQLVDKLKEERIHRVIAPLLQGEGSEQEFRPDDLQYVEDLGLIASRPQIRIANRIYRETLPRELTWPIQVGLCYEQAWYITPDRRLDMAKLLAAFQQFFREHADSWLERYDYKEAGPQLLLQAFLQRVVNGGGRINREYGLGRRRTDLFLEWPAGRSPGLPRPGAAGSDRAEAVTQIPGANPGAGLGINHRLRRPLRRRRSPPHHLRPPAGRALGRKNLATFRIAQQPHHRRVGSVGREARSNG
jgi:hypothetical protein